MKWWPKQLCIMTQSTAPGRLMSVARNTMSSPCSVVMLLCTCIRCDMTCSKEHIFVIKRSEACFQFSSPVRANPATCSWHRDKGTSTAGTRKSPRDPTFLCAKEKRRTL